MYIVFKYLSLYNDSNPVIVGVTSSIEDFALKLITDEKAKHMSRISVSQETLQLNANKHPNYFWVQVPPETVVEVDI